MLCRNPYVKGSSAYPCGRCSPCLDNRKRLWTHRIVLEATQHASNVFATLTYSDEKVPRDGSLYPEHTRDWIKRLRAALPHPIRYYIVGEYGGQSWRPHYHAALFGYPRCIYGNSRYTKERVNCCKNCDLVRDTWGYGFITLGTLEAKSANYIAGYVVKKMTDGRDPRLRPGLHPEFSRMSLKPGLGFGAMHDTASELLKFNLVPDGGDVPSSLVHGKRKLPLGRYLRRQLRIAYGLPPEAPQSTLDQNAETVLSVLQAQNIDISKLPPSARTTIIKNALVDAGTQRVLNMQAKAEIFKSKRKI